MNKTLFILGLYCSGLGVSPLGFITSAHAAIYKSVDANGHITYSNVPIKGAVKLNLDPLPPNSAGDKPGRAKTPTPVNFPRVDRETQNQRDDKRKQILQDELGTEKKMLEDARKAYAEGKATPEVNRDASGKTSISTVKYDEKMQRLQADVDVHEKNVQLLEKELDAIK